MLLFKCHPLQCNLARHGPSNSILMLASPVLPKQQNLPPWAFSYCSSSSPSFVVAHLLPTFMDWHTHFNGCCHDPAITTWKEGDFYCCEPFPKRGQLCALDISWTFQLFFNHVLPCSQHPDQLRHWVFSFPVYQSPRFPAQVLPWSMQVHLMFYVSKFKLVTCTLCCIIPSHWRGRGCQYLINWKGHGPEDPMFLLNTLWVTYRTFANIWTSPPSATSAGALAIFYLLLALPLCLRRLRQSHLRDRTCQLICLLHSPRTGSSRVLF